MAKASKGQAFKESVSDTALAFAINVPLGFLIIEFANWIGIVSTTQTENIQLVILQNIVFTTVAIIRKTYVRVWFENKRLKRLTNT
jgi:hypothetical protein|tara:strand:- start:2145 stop:2402 length:258 start_codon:yes stop_codon:yes gene_type:complete